MNAFIHLADNRLAKYLLPLFSFLIRTPVTLVIKSLNAVGKKIEVGLIEEEKTGTGAAKVFSIHTGKPVRANVFKLNNIPKHTVSLSYILSDSFCHSQRSDVNDEPLHQPPVHNNKPVRTATLFSIKPFQINNRRPTIKRLMSTS